MRSIAWCSAEESDAVVALVAQHKRSYEELQKAFREAKLEVLCQPWRSGCTHATASRQAVIGEGGMAVRPRNAVHAAHDGGGTHACRCSGGQQRLHWRRARRSWAAATRCSARRRCAARPTWPTAQQTPPPPCSARANSWPRHVGIQVARVPPCTTCPLNAHNAAMAFRIGQRHACWCLRSQE